MEEILRQLAPDAARILDPFSGTGTTPLTIARLGREGFYCELNPLLQYLTDVKLTALALPSSARRQIAISLWQQADEFERQLAEVERNAELERAYDRTFGDSIFFEDATYDQVLRARSVIDRLACTEPQMAKFLRCLRSAEDLAGFRNKAITAGINDVTVGKPNGSVDAAVSEVVAQLEASAYDSRIPRMVASYFSAMKAVFGGIKKHLRGGAVVAVDIGDSQYGNIHVPTDKLMTGILQAQGFTLEREITLRKRISRSGLPLRQVLLVFRLTAPPQAVLISGQDEAFAGNGAKLTICGLSF